ncbi:MAG: exonuclease domain-containing protein [Bacteroidota bacterium]
MRLDRNLAFFDLETTGVTVGADRIIEISVIRISPDGTRTDFHKRVNPEIPIPEFVSQLTGITNADVANAPNFAAISSELKQFLEGCDLAGYNSNKFDVPFLIEEFHRVGVDFSLTGRRLVDVQNIFHKMEPRTLAAAYKFYCGKELVNAHAADADTLATYEVFIAQMERYADLQGKDMDYLHKFTNMYNTVDLAGRLVYDDQGRELVNFGKHKGKFVMDVFQSDPSYYDWIMRGDFSRDTKTVFEKLWKRYQEEKLNQLKNKFSS